MDAVKDGHYFACDPGNTSGVAIFNSDGSLMSMGQYAKDAFMDYLRDYPEPYPKVVIIEEYRIFPNKASTHAYSKVDTIQIIGMVKSAAHKWGAEVIEQALQAKPLGYKFAGMKPPKDHSKSHGPDAVAHGYYYLVKQGVIKIKA